VDKWNIGERWWRKGQARRVNKLVELIKLGKERLGYGIVTTTEHKETGNRVQIFTSAPVA
jgi:hypothetical protein